MNQLVVVLVGLENGSEEGDRNRGRVDDVNLLKIESRDKEVLQLIEATDAIFPNFLITKYKTAYIIIS